MQILLSSLRKNVIIAMNAGKIGEISDIIIDPNNAEVLGFFVKTPILTPVKIISKSDILVLDKQAVVINDHENIISPTEVIRINNIMPKKFKITNLKAFTQNHTFLGHIEDIVIDNTTTSIIKFYIRNILVSRILNIDKFICFKDNSAIFSDDCATPLQAPESAIA